MNNSTFPVILYGAGRHAVHAKKQAEAHGLKPVCFADADIEKQGRDYLGLPVLSIEQAAEQYGEFNLYITPLELRAEIFNYLVAKGMPEERVLNYTRMEKCIGCDRLDSNISVQRNGIAFCCRENSLVNNSPVAMWSGSNWDLETCIRESAKTRERLRMSLKDGLECECTGCVRVRNEYRPVRYMLKHIDLSLELPCQLSCIYCKRENIANRRAQDSMEFRFAMEFDYDIFIGLLNNNRMISYDAVISFASGELTINPRIEYILKAMQGYWNTVYTNGVIFNEHMPAGPGNLLVISLDSGTRETYKLVHGVDAYEKVWDNIAKYMKSGVKVASKFILLDENSSDADVEGFIHETAKAGISDVTLSANTLKQKPYSETQMDLIAKMLVMAEQYNLNWYLSPHFTPDEQEVILRLKSERGSVPCKI